LLATGDVGYARDEFDWVLERDGRLKDEAARILSQLQ
jgi:hypothetical protein